MLLGDICIDFGTDIFHKGFCDQFMMVQTQPEHIESRL